MRHTIELKEVERIMTSVWILVSAMIAFLVTYFAGKFFIPYLHRLKYGQTILEIGPSWHKNKQGTPIYIRSPAKARGRANQQ